MIFRSRPTPHRGWIQGPSATSSILVDQYLTKLKDPLSEEEFCWGFPAEGFSWYDVEQHGVLSNWSWEKTLRSFPFGRYRRSRPLVFSLMPRSHGMCG